MRAKLNELADIQFGLQLKSALETSAVGTHLVIQAKDIDADNGHELKIDHLDHFTPDREVDKYVVQNQDVLLLSRGRRPYATVVRGLTSVSPPALALYYFFILRPRSSSIIPDFLAWAINEEEAQEYFAAVSRGTAIPFINKKAAENLEISVPSLTTQAEIVKIHKLAIQEKQLAQLFARKRTELARAICLSAYRREDS